MNTKRRSNGSGGYTLTDALIVIAALGFVIACACWGLSNWADSLPPTKEELAHIRLMNERGIGK